MKTTNYNIGIIILAAGSSSRMSQPKQLLKINGEPLLTRAINTATKTEVGNVIAVLGDNEPALREITAGLSVAAVTNQEWSKGMGGSIKTGLKYLTNKHPTVEAVIIMVCDQPLISSDHLNNLIKYFQDTKAVIVASEYGGTIGVPALFSRDVFAQLLLLKDQHGAKKLIQENLNKVETISFPPAATDLDTMAEYIEFAENYKRPLE